MKQYVVYRLDRTDGTAAEIRANIRSQHIEYMQQYRDRVHMGGPLIDDEGRSIGGVMVIDANDKDEIQQMLDNDPYEIAGLSARIDIHILRWQTNRPATLPPL